MSKNFVIIVAAGSSTRMKGVDKILTKINGYPLISWTLKAFINSKSMDHIVLVIKQSNFHQFRKLKLPEKVSIVSGGASRQESVTKGLKQVENLGVKDEDVVLVHDGARPLTRLRDINKVTKKAKEFGAAILATKSINTIKEVKDLKVKKTINRKLIWLAQTPQAATYKNFKKAFQLAKLKNFTGTDESSLFEYAKIPVKIIPTDNINIKITTPEDIKVIKLLLRPSESSFT